MTCRYSGLATVPATRSENGLAVEEGLDGVAGLDAAGLGEVAFDEHLAFTGERFAVDHEEVVDGLGARVDPDEAGAGPVAAGHR